MNINNLLQEAITAAIKAEIEHMPTIDMRKGILLVAPARELSSRLRKKGIPVTTVKVMRILKDLGGTLKTTTKDGKPVSGVFFEKDSEIYNLLEGKDNEQ